MSSRILGQVGGERLLTDLRHLGQLLHEQAVGQRLGLTALLEWFRDERLRHRRRRAPAPPRLRRAGRADRDDPRQQGPRVPGRLPALRLRRLRARPADRALPRPLRPGPPAAADRRRRQRPAVGVTASTPTGPRRPGEELRKLYVALTRAQSQVVTWWAPDEGTEQGRAAPDALRPPTRQPRRAAGRAGAGRRAGARDPADHRARLRRPGRRARRRRPAPGSPCRSRRTSRWPRGCSTALIDTEWRRTSYSGLIRVEEQAIATSEPEVPGKDDEPVEGDGEEVPVSGAVDVAEAADLPSPMADLPAGAGFGSLVHAILEHADPEAPDLRAELRSRAAGAAAVVASRRRRPTSWPMRCCR